MFAILAGPGCAHKTVTSRPPAQTPAPTPVPPAPSVPLAQTQPPEPGQYLEEGVASWYGLPFNGRRTSNGEIYDMYQLTAAHRTLAFNTVVRVTNLTNGKQVEVRITDRGPFVNNRVIDLSLAAARAIEMVGSGTAHVRLELLSGQAAATIGFFGVQVGAFQNEENAERLKNRLSLSYSPVVIQKDDLPTGTFFRVRVGRLPSEAAANQLAEQLRANEQFATFVVRLDD